MKDEDKKKVVNDKTYNSWGNRIGASNYKPNTYEDKKHFYDTYYKDALEAVSDTNISAETLLAQAYKESNGGRQMPKNNMFGMTSISPEKSGVYKTVEYFDTENYYDTDTINGEVKVKDKYGTDRKLYGVSLVEDKNDKNYGRYKYEVDRYFREYENINEGMKDYVTNFSKTGDYKKALTELNTTKDQEQFIKNISGSYATTNDYATTLLEHYNDFSSMKEKRNLNSSKLAGPKIATKAYPNKLRFAKGGLPDGQVEAEGRELVLRNSHGDMAIIPKKYRQEALDMIKEGCHGCLDNLISTLPKVSDYAKKNNNN
jgi:flagellum-specific peptidoglycan hydrolase FlgJ